MSAPDTLSLADSFRRLIRNAGPLSLSHYMGESNARYYAGKDPLGGAGDFITAPEISQMFGELIGLWMADMWINAGKPDPVYYVELGPGRGTLAQDAFRAARQYGLEPYIHMVESSPALREAQLRAVPGAIWHDDLSSVPCDGPILLIANEFLDALPIRQLVRMGDGWRERMIGLDQDENFIFVAGDQAMDAAVPDSWNSAPEGTILESNPGAAAVMHEAAQRLAEQGGAALFIDYGYDEPQAQSTFQALRAHKKVDPLADPGTADLTALVDFPTLSDIAAQYDVRQMGVTTQGDWLRALGIEVRARHLTARSPEHGPDIARATDRLIADDKMGTLFKVLGLAGPGWSGGAGFPAS